MFILCMYDNVIFGKFDLYCYYDCFKKYPLKQSSKFKGKIEIP